MTLRPRTLWITSTYPTRRSPAGTFIRDLAAEVARCCELTILALVPRFPPLRRYQSERAVIQSLPAVKREAGFVVHFLPVPYLPVWRFPEAAITSLSARLALTQVMGWLRRRPLPDLVHGHMGIPGWIALRAARRTGVPSVTTFHGSDLYYGAMDAPGNGARRRMILDVVRSTDLVVTVSGALRDQAISLGARPEGTIAVLNGFDPRRFSVRSREECRERLGIMSGERTLIGVGRAVPVKGIDVLLHALTAESPDAATHLYWIGDGPELKRLRALSRDFGLCERVQFVGACSHDQVAVWMGAADAVVVSSHTEGGPAVIPEALACGRPVLSTRVGLAAEMLRSGCGVLVQPGSAEALRAGLELLWSRTYDPQAIAAHAAQFSWENTAAKTAAAYGRMVRRLPETTAI